MLLFALVLSIACIVQLTAVPAHAQPAGRRIAEADETLKGHKALAVRVNVTGPRAKILPADTFRAEIERLLGANGISVQADGYPQLTLNIDTLVTNPADYTVYRFDLEFVQTLSLPGAASSPLAKAPTWRSRIFGIRARVSVEQFLDTIRDEVNYFAGSFLTVNPAVAKAAPPAEPRIRTVHNQSGFLSFQFNNAAHDKIALDQLGALIDAKQQVIECLYRAANERHSFWYKTPPAGIRQILESWPNEERHPFSLFGTAAVDACPASAAVARKLLRDGRVQK